MTLKEQLLLLINLGKSKCYFKIGSPSSDREKYNSPEITLTMNYNLPRSEYSSKVNLRSDCAMLTEITKENSSGDSGDLS